MDYLYSIMLLDVEHIDEICKDIKEQYDSGVTTCPLFMVKLVPEGKPLINKAQIAGEKYALFKKKLDAMNVKSGILVQCSIGHGWVLDEKSALTDIVYLTNGKTDNVTCPYDLGFQDYIREQFRILASYSPSTIMVDDDFRLMFRPGKGCACHLHMQKFNALAKTNLSREELYEKLKENKSEDREIREIYIHTQKESLLQSANAMREGVDLVDCKLPMSFCCVGGHTEFAGEIAKILAGKDNPVVVRLNNGCYTPLGAKYFSDVAFRFADANRKLKSDGVDFVLAETDTCPQNRYSTSASSLHAHFTMSILEGASGAKHWITRLATYEPSSGKAYRKILSEHKGFYDTISKLAPTLSWEGFKVPLSIKDNYDFASPDSYFWRKNGWLKCILEKFGLPVYISEKAGGVTLLEGNLDGYFDKEEVKQMLKGSVVLDGAAAQWVCSLGLSQYLGVQMRDWTYSNPTREKDAWGREFLAQPKCREIVLNGATEISTAYNLKDGKDLVRLFPAVTKYKNELGGQVIVFCGEANFNFNIGAPFSFLNESRKKQLAQLLQEVGSCPVYALTDADVYLKCGKTAEGEHVCALFNLCLDELEEIELSVEKQVKNVKLLSKNGEFSPCDFETTSNGVIIKSPLKTLMPQIVLLQY